MKINVIKYRVKIPVNQGVPFEQGNFRGDCKTMFRLIAINFSQKSPHFCLSSLKEKSLLLLIKK
jgi:hypothetical protein